MRSWGLIGCAIAATACTPAENVPPVQTVVDGDDEARSGDALITGDTRTSGDMLGDARTGDVGDPGPGDPGYPPYVGPQYVRVAGISHSTTNGSFEDVPGGVASFTPAAADELWIVLVSARLSSTSTSSANVEAQLVVDGVARGGGEAANSTAGLPLPYLDFTWVSGSVSEHTVQVQIKTPNGTGTIDQLRITAFPLPAGADPHFVEQAASQPAPGGSWNPYLTLSFDPPSTGEYVVLGGINANESPGSGNIEVRLVDTGGAQWPEVAYVEHRSEWLPLVWVRRWSAATTTESFTIEADGSPGAGSTVRYAKLLAFRTDAFEAVEYVEDLPVETTMSTTPVVRSTLAIPAPVMRDFVVLQAMGERAVGDDPTASLERRTEFRMDGAVSTSYARTNSAGGPFGTAGVFGALSTDVPFTLDNAYSTSDATLEVLTAESVILVLRLRP